MRPLAVRAAALAAMRSAGDVPSHVCPPCGTSHGSRPLVTPEENASHGLVELTPHEKKAARQLAVAVLAGAFGRALVENVAGFDDFLDRFLEASP